MFVFDLIKTQFFFKQKGVFAGTVRRSCGNKRCTIAFQGNSALSNACCQTSECNQGEMAFPSMILTLIMIAFHTI